MSTVRTDKDRLPNNSCKVYLFDICYEGPLCEFIRVLSDNTMLDCVLNDEMHVWNDFLAVPVCNFDSRNHLGKVTV